MPQSINIAPWARRIGRDWEKELQRLSSTKETLTGRPISEQTMGEMAYGLTQSELKAQEEHQERLRQAWLQKKQLESGKGSSGAAWGRTIGTIGGALLGTALMPGIGTGIGAMIGGQAGGQIGGGQVGGEQKAGGPTLSYQPMQSTELGRTSFTGLPSATLPNEFYHSPTIPQLPSVPMNLNFGEIPGAITETNVSSTPMVGYDSPFGDDFWEMFNLQDYMKAMGGQ